MKNNSKGFTLVELLVVIAIIGILASVVLAALSTARSKGADKAIISGLVNIRTEAQLYWSDNNGVYGAFPFPNGFSYSGSLCPVALNATQNVFQNNANTNTARINTVIKNINKQSGGTTSTTFSNVRCGTNGTDWAVAATLKSDSTKSWCIDSQSSSKTEASPASATTGIFTTSGVFKCL